MTGTAVAVFIGPSLGFRPTLAGHPWRVIVAPVGGGDQHDSLTGIGARHDGTFDHKPDALLFGRATADRIRVLFDWMARP